MLWVYCDASALVKRYSSEDGTELVNELFHRLPVEQMTCAVIGILEIISVLVRKRNDGRLSPKLFAQAMVEWCCGVVISAYSAPHSIKALTYLIPKLKQKRSCKYY